MKREINELLPQCPFYQFEREKTVVCEGIVEHSFSEQKFTRERFLQAHKEEFCCSMNYTNCPLGKLLFAKYEEDIYG